jgi:SNF2 family DNA or RNA helicase
MIEEIPLIVRTQQGLKKFTATVRYADDRIEFIDSPFAVKDEIKAMKGAKWDAEQGYWSIDDCPRNRFQLAYLKGEKPYAWFDRPLIQHTYTQPLMEHQKHLCDAGLTYHFQIWAAEMGTGKTLAAQELIERSGHKWFFWVGPKASIPNIIRELAKWDFDQSIHVEFFTYEGLVKWVDEWKPGDPLPAGVIFDEASKLKTPTSQRTKAAQRLADLIREKYGHDGYVILMSGTPAPKSPKDWWSLCEIAYPGFLREGSDRALESRLAFMIRKEFDSGIVNVREGWKDDERKCAVCGKLADADEHQSHNPLYHTWQKSVNEVAFMFERLKGLVVIKHKKDCLSLPDKRYRVIRCTPDPSVLMVAKQIAQTSPNAMQAMMDLRELSDGFQYGDKKEGKTRCTHCKDGKVFEWFDPAHDRNYGSIDILDEATVARLERREIVCPQCHGTGQMDKIVRETKYIPCPKYDVLRDLLEENEEHGRIVIFAGFTGSLEKAIATCRGEAWSVVRLDGRGYQVTNHKGEVLAVDPLEFWDNHAGKVAFVAHPESGGMSLTLVAARMAVFLSNSLKPEYRGQGEDRIHRPGMDLNVGCEIVDIVHLPSDDRVREIVRENRRLELMTLGEVQECFHVAA